MDHSVDGAPHGIHPDVATHLHAVQALAFDVASEFRFLGDVAGAELRPDTDHEGMPPLLHGA